MTSTLVRAGRMDGAENAAGGDTAQQRNEAFVEVFSEHTRSLFRFILTLTGNRADADDIFQATSVILLRKFDQFDPARGTFFAWASRMAYLDVKQFRRKQSRSRMFSPEVIDLLYAEASRRDAELAHRESALENCLAKLAPEDRQLVQERYLDELAPKQLARKHDRSTHAIYRALARIHEQLRRCVSRTLAAEAP